LPSTPPSGRQQESSSSNPAPDRAEVTYLFGLGYMLSSFCRSSLSFRIAVSIIDPDAGNSRRIPLIIFRSQSTLESSEEDCCFDAIHSRIRSSFWIVGESRRSIQDDPSPTLSTKSKSENFFSKTLPQWLGFHLDGAFLWALVSQQAETPVFHAGSEVCASVGTTIQLRLLHGRESAFCRDG